MKSSLRIAAIAIVAMSLAVAIWVDVSRIIWEQDNDGLITVVRARDVGWFSPAELAQAGIDVIAVRASLAHAMSDAYYDEVVDADLDLALIVDMPIPPSLLPAEFSFIWIDKGAKIDDRILLQLLGEHGTLIVEEFTDSSQERRLWEDGANQAVRAHEIPSNDLSRMSNSDIVSRFERAVRERGIRCLILSSIPSNDIPQQNLNYFERISSHFQALGYRSGQLSKPLHASRWTETIFHLGISALLLLILMHFLPDLPFACLLLAAAVGTFSINISGIVLRQIDALALALLAPGYATLLLLPHLKSGWKEGFRFLGIFTLASIATGIFLSAILAHPMAVLKIAQFRGVKLSLIVPPIVAVVLFYRRYGWWQFWKLVSSSSGVITWGVLGISAAMLTYLTIRSGNVAGLSLGVEGTVRRWLQEVLVARPRFKEILIGHPLLFLFATDDQLGRWRALPLLFGVVGQVSIVNSFAHAHTPILLSLLRAINGIVIGALLGFLLVLLATVSRLLWQRVNPS